MRKIILASGSPRRKELLESLGYDFTVKVSNVEEVIDEELPKSEIVKSLAYQKAEKVYEENPDCIVIGSDTIVVCNNEIMGKPHTKQQAKEMLEKLRNNSHSVMTGVCILSKEDNFKFMDVSSVYFNDISDEEIEAYIETEEPYDKAGGYAIQGWAGKFIRRINGSYYTIVGLPIDQIYICLKQLENQ